MQWGVPFLQQHTVYILSCGTLWRDKIFFHFCTVQSCHKTIQTPSARSGFPNWADFEERRHLVDSGDFGPVQHEPLDDLRVSAAHSFHQRRVSVLVTTRDTARQVTATECNLVTRPQAFVSQPTNLVRYLLRRVVIKKQFENGEVTLLHSPVQCGFVVLQIIVWKTQFVTEHTWGRISWRKNEVKGQEWRQLDTYDSPYVHISSFFEQCLHNFNVAAFHSVDQDCVSVLQPQKKLTFDTLRLQFMKREFTSETEIETRFVHSPCPAGWRTLPFEWCCTRCPGSLPSLPTSAPCSRPCPSRLRSGCSPRASAPHPSTHLLLPWSERSVSSVTKKQKHPKLMQLCANWSETNVLREYRKTNHASIVNSGVFIQQHFHDVSVAFPARPHQRCCAVLQSIIHSSSWNRQVVFTLKEGNSLHTSCARTLSAVLTLAPWSSSMRTMTVWPLPAAQVKHDMWCCNEPRSPNVSDPSWLVVGWLSNPFSQPHSAFAILKRIPDHSQNPLPCSRELLTTFLLLPPSDLFVPLLSRCSLHRSPTGPWRPRLCLYNKPTSNQSSPPESRYRHPTKLDLSQKHEWGTVTFQGASTCVLWNVAISELTMSLCSMSAPCLSRASTPRWCPSLLAFSRAVQLSWYKQQSEHKLKNTNCVLKQFESIERKQNRNFELSNRRSRKWPTEQRRKNVFRISQCRSCKPGLSQRGSPFFNSMCHEIYIVHCIDVSFHSKGFFSLLQDFFYHRLFSNLTCWHQKGLPVLQNRIQVSALYYYGFCCTRMNHLILIMVMIRTFVHVEALWHSFYRSTVCSGTKWVALHNNCRGFRSWPLSEINDSSSYSYTQSQRHDITNSMIVFQQILTKNFQLWRYHQSETPQKSDSTHSVPLVQIDVASFKQTDDGRNIAVLNVHLQSLSCQCHCHLRGFYTLTFPQTGFTRCSFKWVRIVGTFLLWSLNSKQTSQTYQWSPFVTLLIFSGSNGWSSAQGAKVRGTSRRASIFDSASLRQNGTENNVISCQGCVW